MNRHPYPSLTEYTQRISKHPAESGGYRTKGLFVTHSDIPLVSIITVTYNAGNNLERALQSVREQTYANIEHIVIDGGSTDGTLKLIKQYENSIALWWSEPDKGIYDAFNKGIALASGEFIGILNADDYYESSQIKNAVAALLRTGAPFVHGDIILHGWQGQDVELPGDPNYINVVRYRMPMVHQVTTLCRREIFEKYGMFSLQYRIAGDFDWYLRLTTFGCTGVYEPSIKAHMTAGGVSTTYQRRSVWEVMLSTWRYGLPLHQAIRSSAPKLIFPNGLPGFITRIIHGIQQPKSTLYHVIHYLLNKHSSADQLVPEKKILKNILSAFIDARQMSLTIEPLGLEWIYGAGLRARTFTVLSSDAEATVVQQLLESSGAALCEDIDHADILILDRSHTMNLDVPRLIEQKTLLISASNNWSPSKDIPFPVLDFGGIAGFGALVNPQVSLR